MSDADRDRAISELSEAFQAGRLTMEEFEERSGQALGARTGKDLTKLLTDLPRGPVPAAAPQTGGASGPPLRYAMPRALVAVPLIVAVVIAAIASGQHGHHYTLGVLPVLAVLLFITRIARRGCRGL
ncbi:MAG: DUF1707 domain-containing protein [Streptosporangiaceae bacterium]|nr:DUF1707 domain-containing protein [Streptosporangiaceae bacterium]